MATFNFCWYLPLVLAIVSKWSTGPQGGLVQPWQMDCNKCWLSRLRALLQAIDRPGFLTATKYLLSPNHLPVKLPPRKTIEWCMLHNFPSQKFCNIHPLQSKERACVWFLWRSLARVPHQESCYSQDPHWHISCPELANKLGIEIEVEIPTHFNHGLVHKTHKTPELGFPQPKTCLAYCLLIFFELVLRSLIILLVTLSREVKDQPF